MTAALITRGVNPYLTLPLSFAAGVLAGICTGLIHVKFKVRDLLSGIIMMTALYTVNLVVAGTNNVPLFSQETIFNNSMLTGIFGEQIPGALTIGVILVVALVCKLLLDFYMKTKSGYLLQAVGDNENLVTSLAKDKGNVKILGLAISNGLVALGGCVFCQEEKVFDISVGTGSMVIGLASVIIGVSLFRKVTFVKATTAVFVGAIIYKACVAAAIRFFEAPGHETDYGSAVPGDSGDQHGEKAEEKNSASGSRERRKPCLNCSISRNTTIRARSMKCACFRILI